MNKEQSNLNNRMYWHREDTFRIIATGEIFVAESIINNLINYTNATGPHFIRMDLVQRIQKGANNQR